mgnify:FL=1
MVSDESVGYEVCCRREKGEPGRLVDSVMCGQCGGGHGDYYGGFPDGAADCRDRPCYGGERQTSGSASQACGKLHSLYCVSGGLLGSGLKG